LFHNSLNPIQAQQIVTTETKDVAFVKRVNGFVSAFADRYIVSSRELDEAEIPVVNRCPRPVAYKYPQPDGTFLFLQYEMGEPLRLPKWQAKFETAST
jgi:hypothetical protein